jgi:hypothetical protein
LRRFTAEDPRAQISLQRVGVVEDGLDRKLLPMAHCGQPARRGTKLVEGKARAGTEIGARGEFDRASATLRERGDVERRSKKARPTHGTRERSRNSRRHEGNGPLFDLLLVGGRQQLLERARKIGRVRREFWDLAAEIETRRAR